MLKSSSASPPAKKVKLTQEGPIDFQGDCEDDAENHCSICLQAMEDRTVVPTCSHEFCFDCLMIWTAQSRRCPLCAQNIGDYLIHDIRSRLDYRKHYLAPLTPNSPQPLLPLQTTATLEARNAARRRRRDRERRRRHEELDERDKLELSIAFRRWIYKHDLYAKHVASNSFTKYRPYPTPAQFSAAPDLISRTTTFLRRELQVWQGLDVEFLTNLIISLMKAIDIRSESAVKLLAEFLDMDAQPGSGNLRANAEHFAHEVYSYVRSPFRDLFVYDSVVQYERPLSISPPPQSRRPIARWQAEAPRTQESNRRGSYSHSQSPRQTENSKSSLGEQDGRATDLQCSDRSPKLNVELRRHGGQETKDDSASRTPKVRTGQHSHEGDSWRKTVPSGSAAKGKEKENSTSIENSGSSSLNPNAHEHVGDSPLNERSAINSSKYQEPWLPSRACKGKQAELGGHSSLLPATQETPHASPVLGPPEAEERAHAKKIRPRSLLESIKTHLKPAEATSRFLKKEGGISLHNPESKHSHDNSTPHRADPSSFIPSAVRRSDRTDKHRFTDNDFGVSGNTLEINPLDPSNVYFTQSKTAPGNGLHPSTSPTLRSGCGDNLPLVQQRTSLPNDGLQGEFDLVQAEPEISPTLSAGAEQVEMLEADLVEAPLLAPDGVDEYYVRDNRARQIDNSHVAVTPRPATPMTVPKHRNEPSNPDLIMMHQSAMSKPPLNDIEKDIREVRKPKESVKEVDKRQNPSINHLSAEVTVSTSAMEGNPARGGVRRSMLDCRGIDGETKDDKSVPVLDITAREASLKRRMRLRAKLAAEKQVAESR